MNVCSVHVCFKYVHVWVCVSHRLRACQHAPRTHACQIYMRIHFNTACLIKIFLKYETAVITVTRLSRNNEYTCRSVDVPILQIPQTFWKSLTCRLDPIIPMNVLRFRAWVQTDIFCVATTTIQKQNTSRPT